MLEARGLVKRFGGLVAVDRIDLAIDQGETRCIIGPNGAGKTTLFNLLTGDDRPTEGHVLLQGRRIDALPVHRIARLGVVRKFQVPAVFPDLSLIDNLRVAAGGRRPLRSLFGDGGEDEEALWAALAEVELAPLAEVPAAQLGHGQVQRLEIAMVLVTQPQVLLLDEPTAGMTDEETVHTAQILRHVADARGLTIVIVEHDIDFIKMIGDRITVLHKGKVLFEGSHAEVEGNADVRRIYLGEQPSSA